MATNAVLKKYISPDEYLEREEKALDKSEYYDGEIFAMAGASPAHVYINSNLIVQLSNRLADKDCITLTSDMRLHVPQAKGLFTYPDVSVVCGKPEFQEEYKNNLLNPTVLVEILSDSTAEYDRTIKFEMYRKIESLKEYMLVNQKRPFVEVYSKSDTGQWVYSAVSDISEEVALTSLNIAIPLAEIYKRVEFEETK